MVKEVNGWKIHLQRTKNEGFQEGIKEGLKEGFALSQEAIEIAKIKAEEANQKAEEERQKAEEANKKAVLGFIQNTRFKDAQIADILDLPITFVEAIRKELKKIAKSPKKTKVVSPPQ